MRLADCLDRLDRLDRLGGLAHPLLVGGAAVVIGIFLVLLTSTCDAHAAGPIHTHQQSIRSAPAHVSSRGSSSMTDAADQDGSATMSRRTGGHRWSRVRVEQTSLDPATDRKTASTVQTASTSAPSRDRVPRARLPHHLRAQTSEPVAAVPLAHAPQASVPAHSPMPPDDGPSGPLPTQDTLVLQSSPLATTFGPGIPFAFFGPLALILARRVVSEHTLLRTFRGMFLSVPWPPG